MANATQKAEAVRRDAMGGRLPAIIVSAEVESSARTRAVKAGVSISEWLRGVVHKELGHRPKKKENP